MLSSFTWDADKNALLQAARGFGFEDIVAAIDAGGLLDDIENPSGNFLHQRALVVKLNGYAVFVPYVIEGSAKFLKTAYYSRRETKLYLNR